MKMMKRKIMHAGSSITIPEDHLRAYFAMNEHQLKSLEGNLQTVMSAQLVLMLKVQGCKCPMNFCKAFRKIEKAVLYEKPAQLEVVAEQLTRRGSEPPAGGKSN